MDLNRSRTSSSSSGQHRTVIPVNNQITDTVTSNMMDSSKIDGELENLKRQLAEKEKKISKMSIDYNKTMGDLKNEQLETKRLGRENVELVSKLKCRTHNMKHDSALSEENDRLTDQLERINIENAKLQTELEHLRTSLSRFAGSKLSEDNPYITDLSDPNRPQRLAEKFNKLYDDTWTDAFEVFSASYADEKKTCEFLLNIMQECWQYCLRVEQQQLVMLNDACLFPHVIAPQPSKSKKSSMVATDANSQEIKILKDARRLYTKQFLPNLCDYYWDTLGDISKNTSLKPYVYSCLELCWYSVITEPPIDYIFTAEKVDDFRAYTKKGDKVDYVVWPAMYLHKNGPLLYQGVVQFKQSGSR